MIFPGCPSRRESGRIDTPRAIVALTVSDAPCLCAPDRPLGHSGWSLTRKPGISQPVVGRRGVVACQARAALSADRILLSRPVRTPGS